MNCSSGPVDAEGATTRGPNAGQSSMLSHRRPQRALAISALALLVMVSSASCGCTSGASVVLVERRGERFFGCEPSSGQGDSDPPVCGAPQGSDGNPRLRGPAVGQLAALVADGSSAFVDLERDCDRVVGARAHG